MDIKNQSYNILKGYNMLLYFTGSMVMYEPNEECIVDFWQQGIIRRLPVSSSNPNFTVASSMLRDSCADKTACLRSLKEDYGRLFDGSGLPLAPAYESLYINLLQSDRRSSPVGEFYDSYGWISKYKGQIRDDHLGVELLFLTRLVENYLAMDDQVCLVEIRSEIRRFIEEHIFSWLSGWVRKMQEYAHTAIYRGIAILIYACIEDIYSLCDNSPVTVIRADVLKN